jgi:ATP-dependent DNA helicase RecQ
MADVVQRRRMIDEGAAAVEIKRIEHGKLSALLAICETAGCRRQAILAHFGEAHAGNCGNCDTCRNPVETWDGTEAAIKALAAVYRTGERFGAGHVIDVLTGVENDKTRRFGHSGLLVFGVGKDIAPRVWQSIFRQLIAAGYLAIDHDNYGALKLEEDARGVFRRDRQVFFRKDHAAAKGTRKAKREAARSGLSERDEALFQSLRAVRSALAKQQGVAAYVIFADTTLIALAQMRPATADALLDVPGIGQAKREKFGAAFLKAISEAE